MAVELCDWLVDRNVHVHVHDPVVKALPASWNGKVTQFGTALGALKGADVLVISTEWPQYKDVSEAEIVGIAPGIAVLDANRFLAHMAGSAGLKYLAVGSPGRGSDR
jgi:UDPglucose 6-dehydrogenase